jgi:hypothetical protein
VSTQISGGNSASLRAGRRFQFFGYEDRHQIRQVDALRLVLVACTDSVPFVYGETLGSAILLCSDARAKQFQKLL